MRDKLKLETMSRAYGVSYSQPRRRQLSPVKKRAANGSAPPPDSPAAAPLPLWLWLSRAPAPVRRSYKVYRDSH
jgi:hypothetical protein